MQGKRRTRRKENKAKKICNVQVGGSSAVRMTVRMQQHGRRYRPGTGAGYSDRERRDDATSRNGGISIESGLFDSYTSSCVNCASCAKRECASQKRRRRNVLQMRVCAAQTQTQTAGGVEGVGRKSGFVACRYPSSSYFHLPTNNNGAASGGAVLNQES